MSTKSKNGTNNKFVTSTALDFNASTGRWNRKKKLEINLAADTSPVAFGRSITPSAFRKMIGSKLLKLHKEFIRSGLAKTDQNFESFLENHRCAVEFGREPILRILSQEGCIGLRFTFCLNDLEEDSIIVSGVEEENGQTFLLKRNVYKKTSKKKTDSDMPMDDEKGVPSSYAEFFKQTKLRLSDLVPPQSAKKSGKGKMLTASANETSSVSVDKFADAVFGLI